MIYWIVFLCLVIVALVVYIAVLQNNINKNSNYKNDFFKSRQSELLFYLTELDGKQRNKLLGLTDFHYENKKKANKWYKEIRQYVHPDKGGDDKAFHILQKIYDVLIEEDNDE